MARKITYEGIEFGSYKSLKLWYKQQEIERKFSKQIIAERALWRQREAKVLKEFWNNIDAPTINSCWRMKFNRDYKRTTKWCKLNYTRFKGVIPENMELHHTCENCWCVNPKHLEPLSFSDHLIAHNKRQKVKWRAMNKYQKAIREALSKDQEVIEIDQE